ncbi:MAG: cation:proton antiporter [Thermoplasmata archaeon]
MNSITPILVLLLLAITIVIAARRVRAAYTVALVLFGFAVGIIGSFTGYAPLTSSVHYLLAPGLFFNLLLPPIIFEAALHVNYRLLRKRAALILSLAFIGVVFTTLFTGAVVAYFTVLPLTAALLLAAILSPTDPIAIVDLFRRLRVPEELATIVESESLLNDAVGVIMFTILLEILTTGSANATATLLQFVDLTGGGLLVGLLVGGAVYLLYRELHDPAVETALSVVAAFGSFLLADAVGASGIIACAIAGIAVGTWVVPRTMDTEVRHSLTIFWNVVVYIANSLIFLVMGLLFALSHLLQYLGLIAVVTVVMTLGRAAFVYAHRPLSEAEHAQLPTRWYNVIAMSGIRGAIPVVLALSLLSGPTGLASNTVDAIVASVFGVAFVSIIAGNVAADWYVKRAFRPGTT